MTRAIQDPNPMTMAGLNLIQQALTIYDRDLQLAICNRRFQDMFELPNELVTPGARFEDTIRYLAERGDYGDIGDFDLFVAERVRIARAFEPHYMERTRANGLTISVEGSPLPEGGWVTVYTDITRTKHHEAMLSAKSEELSDQLIGYSQDLATANRKLKASITALEEAKRQISEAEARTRLTAEMMPAHIAHIGPDERYRYSNRRLSTIMPGSSADPIGLEAHEVLGAQAYAELSPHLARAFEGKPGVFEFTHHASSRRIRVALTPDKATGGAYVLSMDVTEETQTRAALQQTRRREIAAQLTSGMAHDFSNLLTIILGMQSRLEKLELPPDAGELVQATTAAARRGGHLLNRIADMTGPREYRPVSTALPVFLKDFETLALSTLSDEIVLKIDNKTDADVFDLDVGMMQDALINLVLNARDACGTRGTITLRVECIKDTWLEFAIEDTGPGFSTVARAKAFDPFFTTKGGEGSGLGLSMVYDMTKLSGGRTVLDNTSRGGRVAIQLPLRKSGLNPGTGMALLVEDSDDLRATIRDMLREIGFSVVEASQVPEAQALLQQLPEIKFVLSDIDLEGEATGYDLLSALPRDRCQSVLMTSLPAQDPRLVLARERFAVLRKPFSVSDLQATLQNGSTP